MAKKPKKTDELVVVYRAIAELKPDPRNARQHPGDQIAQLKASIEKFGFTQPVLLHPNGMIGAGHGRVIAAGELGMTTVPTITIKLTEKEWRAYAVLDNAIPLQAEWNVDMLQSELRALQDLDGLDLDFSALGLDKLPQLELPEEEAAARQSGDPVIQFNIVFDDLAQQQRWNGFVRHLKGKYPKADTLAQRIIHHLDEAKL